MHIARRPGSTIAEMVGYVVVLLSCEDAYRDVDTAAGTLGNKRLYGPQVLGHRIGYFSTRMIGSYPQRRGPVDCPFDSAAKCPVIF